LCVCGWVGGWVGGYAIWMLEVVALALLTAYSAGDDIPEASVVEALVKDLRDIRQTKIRERLRHIHDGFVAIRNATSLELVTKEAYCTQVSELIYLLENVRACVYV
jgi:hypothetical protein